MPFPALAAWAGWGLVKKLLPYAVVLLVAAAIVLYIWFKSKAECEQDHQREQATQTIERIEDAAQNEAINNEIMEQHQIQIKRRLPTRKPADPVFRLDPYRACLLQAKEPLHPGVCD